MTVYRVVHETRYAYAEPASLCYNEARLLPRAVELPQLTQRCLNQQIEVEPPYTDFSQRVDYFGNNVFYYTIRQPHTEMVIRATSEVSIEPLPDARATLLGSEAGRMPWESVCAGLLADKVPTTREARQFVINSPLIPIFAALVDYASPSFTPARPVLEAVHDLMQRIHRELDFVPGATTIATPLAEVLAARRGVCQDYAHLMIGCLRAMGLAARYVSGYIETVPPPGQEKLQGADASHAWVSLYVPDLGWIDFDPTNDAMPSDQHIILGWGRDFSDITPLKGVFFSTGDHVLDVAVDVTRLS